MSISWVNNLANQIFVPLGWPESVGKAGKTPCCPLVNQDFRYFWGLYPIFTHTCIVSIVSGLVINGYKYWHRMGYQVVWKVVALQNHRFSQQILDDGMRSWIWRKHHKHMIKCVYGVGPKSGTSRIFEKTVECIYDHILSIWKYLDSYLDMSSQDLEVCLDILSP